MSCREKSMCEMSKRNELRCLRIRSLVSATAEKEHGGCHTTNTFFSQHSPAFLASQTNSCTNTYYLLSTIMVYTTPTTRARIVTMMDNGATQRQVGRQLGIDHKTAGNVYKKIKQGYSYYYYAPKSGRPTLLSKTNHRVLARKV